jgi:hypothetical protein
MDEQRSRETRAHAELALVRLFHVLGDQDTFLVVLGGLVPETLASEEDFVPEHLGTTDVDVLLITHVDSDADLGSVEHALEQLDFKPDINEDGWRWRGPIDGVAAHRILASEFADDLDPLRATLIEVRERYVMTSDSGPIGYAEQAREADPDADLVTLRADAVDVVQRFFTALDIGR